MARRKRMQYDPPHLRTGRKGRRPATPRPDQIALTRRMFLAKGAVVAAFGALAGRLGYMQLIKGEEFVKQAEANTLSKGVLKPTRGVIYDRKGRELATNERTWEVRVLPKGLPDAEEAKDERARVLDHLTNALNLPDALVLRPNGVPEGQEATVYVRTAQLLGKALVVEPTDDPTRLPVLGTPGELLKVNGHEFHLFVYTDEAARKVDSGKITADGRKIQGVETPWQAGAEVAAVGNVLTVLVAPDKLTAGRVGRAVGTLGLSSTVDDVVSTLRQNGYDEWAAYITQEMQRKDPLVILEDDLSPDKAALCRAHLNELPGVFVTNRLDYLIENGVHGEAVTVKRGVPREVALKLEANKLALPGVELDGGALTRRYRGGEALSHILGYVGMINREEFERHTGTQLAKKADDPTREPLYEGDDIIGQDGLERVMEAVLRGKPGSRVVERNSVGGLEPVENETVVPPIPGDNLNLTIDLELQRAAGEILRDGIRFANEDRKALGRDFALEAGAGSVVAIDPRNGEVLAMVSYPHYDNQLFVDGISDRKYDEYVSEAANKPLFDRTLRGKYPPGSTLKLFLAAAALNERKIDTRSTFSCTGAIKIPIDWNMAQGNTHPCWLKDGHQALDVFGGIEQSCDVFFYNVGTPEQKQPNGENLHYRDVSEFGSREPKIGEKHYFSGLGIKLIKENLRDQFWFGQTTGIDLPTEEAASALWERLDGPNPAWSAGETILTSIGQGEFLVTPLQLAVNTAALGNGGSIPKPRLVRETFVEGSQKVNATKAEELRRLSIAPEHLATVKEGMRRVCHGEAGSARVNYDGSSKWALTNPKGEPEILIAGKTGTAEVGEAREDGTYNRQHAWFTLFAPLENPEIAITVVIEDGGEGSASAVPVADRVLRAYLEATGQRPRGLVLNKEEGPLPPDVSVLAPAAVFPKPGTTGIPGDLRQD
ncbi:MAG: Peptidoglycan D,D-transpeptidase MrdA [uncultured Thermomicrobiales bacterium]|uniref:Peptidoglycan D,D-transpeptidase MrdA n=1 Tax=uncultured Thermomicrobiales bacterium TaxID=1645740 RepID=A0A6J4UWG4_9BACT|nr:MAG: Peptidoglycan D,D-transpeptidase MrdA [uncultured Thermomicrobiales bacterium]